MRVKITGMVVLCFNDWRCGVVFFMVAYCIVFRCVFRVIYHRVSRFRELDSFVAFYLRSQVQPYVLRSVDILEQYFSMYIV